MIFVLVVSCNYFSGVIQSLHLCRKYCMFSFKAEEAGVIFPTV